MAQRSTIAPRGLLLLNLGTPDEPTTAAVRRYLREFLSDPRVLDINPVGRWLLLNLIILPTRPSKSAEAYRAVWTERGSPLLYHGEDLCELVAKRLGDEWSVALGMRYGKPSITTALEKLRAAGVNHLAVLPLFPQYSSSTTGSALEKVFDELSSQWNVPSPAVVPPFYNDPLFARVFAGIGRGIIEDKQPDLVLFSFHGLPVRHIQKGDPHGVCLASDACCATIRADNKDCYRAQCFATARAIAHELGLSPEKYRVTFQSRLGRDPWIQPYTDAAIREAAAAGVKKLVVYCPAFVADCLETLEEIGMQGAEHFVAAGGEELTLVPSLNSAHSWADAVATMAQRTLPQP